MLALVFLKLFINPLHPRSAIIEDFTLSSARWFYLSKGDPLGLKGLKNCLPLHPKSALIDFTLSKTLGDFIIYSSKGDSLGL